MQDINYKHFQAKLIPRIKAESIIGVRTPVLRKYTKQLQKAATQSLENQKALESFLENLPHKVFNENQLYCFIISDEKNFSTCIEQVEKFLPFVDNWATCDQLSPKVFKQNKKLLLTHIHSWIALNDSPAKETNPNYVYTVRFGIGMLMRYFLDDDFCIDHLEFVAKLRSNEYYINMMIAWFFATALTKQYEATLPFIETHKLETWSHNKTIQKAMESYRVPSECKDYLRKLKR